MPRCSPRWPRRTTLAADETPVNVLDKTAQPPGPDEKEEDPEEKGRHGRRRGSARADRPHPRRAADLAAGHRLPPQGRRRGRDPGRVRRLAHHRRLHRLPAPAVPAGRYPAVLRARDPQMPRRRETRPRRAPVLGRRHHRHPARGAPGRRGSPRPRRHQPSTRGSSQTCGNATTPPSRPGSSTTGCGTGTPATTPATPSATWLRGYKEQVFLFTRDFSVDWTNNVSERGAKAAKRHQAVSGYWHSWRPLPGGAASRPRSAAATAQPA